jgi:RNA polymerase sigma-70 factor (ECF subfamily)
MQAAPAAEVDFDRVYAEYLPRVYNFFLYRVNDEARAEDLTAATFLRAWQSRDRYRHDRGAFSTWLFTIARRVVVDEWRKERPDVPLDDLPQLPDSTAAPEEVIQQRQMLARLSVLLARLTARDQELVALKYGGGLNNREIARVTGLSESNVGTTLSRVIQKLRDGWETKP